MKRKEIEEINDALDKLVLYEQENIMKVVLDGNPKPNRNIEMHAILRMYPNKYNLVISYPSITVAAKDIARELKMDDYTEIAHDISKVLRGKRPTAYGSTWKLVTTY